MNQAVLGYEQKLFVNGTQISGVQSINGSYAIQEKSINILGWGHVNSGFYEAEAPSTPCLSVLNSPLEGAFSINSTLVSEDFFLSLTGDNPFSGSIHHDSQYFGFYSGYITNHSVSCSVGQIPTTSTTIKIFGDIGGAPDPQLNASGTNPFPTISVPNQGSMSVECSGATTDRITSFNHSINVPISPIYIVGSASAVQVDVVWPITATTSFTLEVDEYKYNRLRKYLISPTVQDIAIKINDCFGNKIQNYKVKDARFLGESVAQSVGGRLTVNLRYNSYYNKRGNVDNE